MSKDEITSAIKSYARRGGKLIGFNGGEPSIYPDLLFYAIRTAFLETGVGPALITNASWCDTYENGLAFLSRCCLLSSMTISFDKYHAEFIDFSYIRRAVGLARYFGIPVYLSVTGPYGADIRTHYTEFVSDEDADFIMSIKDGLPVACQGYRLVGRAASCPEVLNGTRKPSGPIERLPRSTFEILPGRRLVWACVARNPVLTFSFQGDWTLEADRLSNEPLIIAHKTYSSYVCDVCFARSKELAEDIAKCQ